VVVSCLWYCDWDAIFSFNLVHGSWHILIVFVCFINFALFFCVCVCMIRFLLWLTCFRHMPLNIRPMAHVYCRFLAHHYNLPTTTLTRHIYTNKYYPSGFEMKLKYGLLELELKICLLYHIMRWECTFIYVGVS